MQLDVDSGSFRFHALVKRWFQKHPRYPLHFTPTYESWINLAERLFAEITDKAIRRGTFRSVPALEKAMREYLDTRNETPKPFGPQPRKPFLTTSADSACELLAEDDQDMPLPKPMQIHQESGDFSGWTWGLVDVPIEGYWGPAEKINITLPARVLKRIDAYARSHGQTRSGFIAQAAQTAMAN